MQIEFKKILVMQVLQEWIYNLLMRWGLSVETAQVVDNLVLFVGIVLVGFLLDYVCRNIVLVLFHRLAVRTKTELDDMVMERKIVHKVMRFVPAVFVYIALPYAFPAVDYPVLLPLLQKLFMIYMIAIALRFFVALLNLGNDIYNLKQTGRSIKGLIQVFQVIIIFLGVIIIIGLLIDKSPTKLIAGLGASAAILSLVFKDSLMGFIAGVQLTAQDMLRTGDWITMAKYGVDGVVTDVTLNAVKVRNFDNTTVTIPPYALVSDSFQNWRGMSESPGRRVKRSINIDMSSVKFCTPEMLARFRKIALLTDYIDSKERELHDYNESHGVDDSITVNGRRQTNLGVFRAYIERYLRNHPLVSKELSCMVRHLQPTEKGIPVELYLFLTEKRWVQYEGIQADIFDHLLAVIPEFELSAFQAVSGADLRGLKEPAGVEKQ